MNPFQAVI